MPKLSRTIQQRLRFSDVPGVKLEGPKFIMIYTCKVCETRSAKKISKFAYEEGIVVVRCGGCSNLHLIADRKGLYEFGGFDLNKYLLEKEGKGVKVINDENVMELEEQDLIGYINKESTNKMDEK